MCCKCVQNHGDPVLRRGNKFLSLLLVNEGTNGQGIKNTKGGGGGKYGQFI